VTDFRAPPEIAGHVAEIIGHDPEIAANSLEFHNFFRHTRSLCVSGGRMPAARISMRQIIEVLRLKYEAKLSHERIARACGLSNMVLGSTTGRLPGVKTSGSIGRLAR
jgi:hypothetical protein